MIDLKQFPKRAHDWKYNALVERVALLEKENRFLSQYIKDIKQRARLRMRRQQVARYARACQSARRAGLPRPDKSNFF